MSSKNDIIDAARAAWDLIAGLVPGALGAGVASVYEKGLTWSQRFIALAVGIIVSYYAGKLFAAMFSPSDFVRQGISFTLGMVAHKSVPGFIDATSATFRSIPTDIWAAIKDRFGAK